MKISTNMESSLSVLTKLAHLVEASSIFLKSLIMVRNSTSYYSTKNNSIVPFSRKQHPSAKPSPTTT
jgi:hypothetical protein